MKSTNHKPWPFEHVKVKFCFLKGLLKWLTAAKNAIVSWLLNFRIRILVESTVTFKETVKVAQLTSVSLFFFYVGHIDCALDCITDRSMFVAKSAQSLIAKYLIRESNWILSSDSEELMSNNTVEATYPRHVIERLRSKLNSQCTAPGPAPVAVFEVMRMLLLEDSYLGQKVLQESKLFPRCLDLFKAGSATVSEKLVDMLCEFAKNTR